MRNLILVVSALLVSACGDTGETTGALFLQQERPSSAEVARTATSSKKEAAAHIRSERLGPRGGVYPRGMFGDRPVFFDQRAKTAVVGDEVIPLPIPDNRIFFQGGHTIAWVEDDKEHVTVMDLRDRSLETIQVRRGFAALEVTDEGEPIIMTSDGWVPLRSN